MDLKKSCSFLRCKMFSKSEIKRFNDIACNCLFCLLTDSGFAIAYRPTPYSLYRLSSYTVNTCYVPSALPSTLFPSLPSLFVSSPFCTFQWCLAFCLFLPFSPWLIHPSTLDHRSYLSQIYDYSDMTNLVLVFSSFT